MKYLRFETLILASTLLLTSICAYAKPEKWYRVEVLIFETKDKNALAEEWPLEPGKPSTSNAVKLVSDPNVEFSQLPDKQLSLTEVKQKIQKNYRLVLHKGWRQILNDKEHAQSVHLLGGKQYSGNAGMDNEMIGQMSAGSYEVDGIVRFSGGRFLHVDSDLLFRKPMMIVSPENSLGAGISTASSAKFDEVTDKNNWQSQPNARLQSFRMKESARLRLEEIQYIDHPLYGMIIMVSQEKTS